MACERSECPQIKYSETNDLVKLVMHVIHDATRCLPRFGNLSRTLFRRHARARVTSQASFTNSMFSNGECLVFPPCGRTRVHHQSLSTIRKSNLSTRKLFAVFRSPLLCEPRAWPSQMIIICLLCFFFVSCLHVFRRCGYRISLRYWVFGVVIDRRTGHSLHHM